MADVVPLLAVVALVAVTSLTLRRRSGIARPDHHAFTAAEMAAAGIVANRPTFVVFTAPGCSTCGPTRDLVQETAARHDAAVTVLDATEHEALATAHHVLRAPTVFLVHPDGTVAGRISGLPRQSELVSLVASPAQHVDAAA